MALLLFLGGAIGNYQRLLVIFVEEADFLYFV